STRGDSIPSIRRAVGHDDVDGRAIGRAVPGALAETDADRARGEERTDLGPGREGHGVARVRARGGGRGGDERDELGALDERQLVAGPVLESPEFGDLREIDRRGAGVVDVEREGELDLAEAWARAEPAPEPRLDDGPARRRHPAERGVAGER